MVPELVSSFTQQSDPHAERLCTVIKTVGELAISLAVALTAQAANTALGPTPIPQPGQLLGITGLGTQLTSSTVLSTAQPGFAKATSWVITRHVDMHGVPGFLKKLSDNLKPIQWDSQGLKFSYNWWQTFQSFPFLYYMSAVNMVQSAATEYGALGVEGGAGHGGWGHLCSSFEGDFRNGNDKNIGTLQAWIPHQFSFIQSRLERFYKDVYSGYVPFRAGPSMMSFMLAGNSWTGNNSFLSDLRDPEKWQ